MSLVNELLKGLLPEEEKKQTTAVYAGGFKPPTSGHFEVVEQALKENPEIDEFIIFIGNKERNGISQTESLLIWEIYNNYLPFKVKIVPTSVPPIKAVYNFAKEHPTREVLWVIGAREGNEEDFKDITLRTKSISKYPNLELRTIVTSGGVSGTAARNASKISLDKFKKFVPDVLSDEETEEVYNIVADKIQEINPEDGKAAPYGSGYKKLNENASYKQHIDVQDKIDRLTQHMVNKGMNIEPLPTLEFVDGDSENAKDFFGKTAYYDPNKQHIVLYTEGRHPKDIVRSYAHEMIHHIQNLEDRLGNISTTNTQEDDNLNNIEAEANLKGTMTFRNWTDSLNEGKQVGLLYHITTPEKLKKILDSNTLKGSYISWDGGDTDFLGISTTRNKNFLYDDNKIQIVLNGDKISNNYKIQPYDYWGREYNIPDEPQIKDEDEEIIKVGKDGLKNVKNYIIKINDFTDSLNENILNEIGDLSQAPYKWKTFSKPEGSNDPYSYYDFSTDNGTKYQVIFNREEFGKTVNYDMSFVAKGKDGKEFSADALTGGNEPLKIMSTIVDITREQIKKAGDVEFITFEPTKGKTGEEGAKGNIRSKLYKIIIKKNFPKAKVSGTDTVVVDMTSYKNNGLNEAIVGEKIECGNCGWSWNIVDGGDDLFICHKCGNDNTPFLNEIQSLANPSSVDPTELSMGIDVEMEHTNSKLVAKIIALQHLGEDPKYYTKLASLGLEENKPFGLKAYSQELARLREEEGEYKIYLDMDGVIADFNTRFKNLSGIEPREFENKYGKNAFWEFIDEENKISFWVGIPPMPGASELVSYVSKHNYEILTAPSIKKQSRLGKSLWVRNHIGDIFPSKPKINFKFSKEKHLIKPNLSNFDILIDDRQTIIDNWNNAGGNGILYQSSSQAIADLKKLGL